MAKKTAKSGLMAKVGNKVREAVAEHRDDETNFGGGGNLPEGIEGGVAQLVDCKFDTYSKGDNVGEYYFYAAGVVKSPKVHGGVRIEGMRTSIMEPVCDTPNRSRKTVEEHVAWIMNEMRKLGIDTSDLDGDDLEAAAASLKEEQPHFRFRTWKGDPTPQFPNPRVNEQWRGACDYIEDDTEEGDEVLDETEDEEVEEEEVEEEEVEEEEVEEEEAGEDETEEEDEDEDTSDVSVQDMGVLTDNGKADYTGELTEMAGEYGIDPDEYATWEEVGTAIAKARAEGDGEEEESDDEEEEFLPEKGEVYFYKPPKAKKAIECEVTAVFTGKQTVNLKSLDDDRVFKSVGYDSLESD